MALPDKTYLRDATHLLRQTTNYGRLANQHEDEDLEDAMAKLGAALSEFLTFMLGRVSDDEEGEEASST